MSQRRQSGQEEFIFVNCPELRTLPNSVLSHEQELHGGFAVDSREGYGHIYYGMPRCGLLKISPDLSKQDLIELPTDLIKLNFHSTKIGEFDGKVRLFMPANEAEQVAVVSMEGEIDFILPRPELDQYIEKDTAFCPTDTVLHGDKLLVSDGYGANYISTLDLTNRQWTSIFGGKTDMPSVHGKFGTAHGINQTPTDNQLIIADRPNSRLEVYSFDGHYKQTHPLINGSRPCGINYTHWKDNWYAVVASLDDPDPNRPAPIYILDGITYKILSTIRPKEDLGIERVDHLHNVVWHQHNGRLFLVCQSWNPGHYFVLAQI